MKRVRWSKVWSDFNKWCDDPSVTCSQCGKLKGSFPRWGQQKKWIEKRINEELSR